MPVSTSSYLYKRGPWPQPAPGWPDEATPTILHVPEEEQWDWNWNLATRYVKQLVLETPQAMIWALRHRGVKLTTNDRFRDILTDGIFSKFLTPDLDPPDLALFAARVPALNGVGGAGWFKTDYSVVRWITPDGDSSVAPCVVLWREISSFRYEAVAIAVNKVVFLPGDGDGWALAKAFALQAAGIATTLYQHPLLHFPTDAVNGVVKSLFPKDHLMLQWLVPHFRLAMGVDDAVLHGTSTVLQVGKVYAPYPGLLVEHLEIVATLWRGLDHTDGTPNRAYPKYKFQMGPRTVHSRYGEFLKRYYDVFLKLGKTVAAQVPKNDPLLHDFAEHLSFWIPGFPDEVQIKDPDVLAVLFASIVADVAIGHTADHYLYAQTDIQEVPFRLHVPVPSTVNVPSFDASKLTTWRDALNYKMCMSMFFAPYPVTRLASIDYGFSDPSLRDANVTLRADLADVERSLIADGINYMPLPDIACSVQF